MPCSKESTSSRRNGVFPFNFTCVSPFFQCPGAIKPVNLGARTRSPVRGGGFAAGPGFPLQFRGIIRFNPLRGFLRYGLLSKSKTTLPRDTDIKNTERHKWL
jgi:hypothetical protein